jgi:hypothetical protein
LTKAAVHAASTASVASASLTHTATRSDIVLDDTRDENLWGSVLDWAERAEVFVRAQTANAEDVSGSDEGCDEDSVHIMKLRGVIRNLILCT